MCKLNHFVLFILINICRFGASIKCPTYHLLASLPYVEPDDPAVVWSEDDLLDVPGLIDKYGYNASTYTVLTEDNYILTLHRLSGKKGEQSDRCKQVVLLMHGLVGSSAIWMFNEHNSLAFLLADEGYDVWCGNARGSLYSRKHTYLNPDECKGFWNFSHHEVGYYDLPAMIDFILAATGNEKLHYVAHSQGGTVFFIMASTRQEYNQKILTMSALAPPVYQPAIIEVADNYTRYNDPLGFTLHLRYCCEYLPFSKLLARQAHKYCVKGSPYLSECTDYYKSIGEDPRNLNISRLPFYFSHNPSGASSKQSDHFTQLSESGMFRQFDYGSLNYLHYNDSTPPSYNLSNVVVPVALFYSNVDDYVPVNCVLRLKKELKNVVESCEIPLDLVGHVSYLLRGDVIECVHKKIVDVMKKFT